jgi:hypothetical protein
MDESKKKHNDVPPHSVWNNNPGNLRYNPKIDYEGSIGYDPDTKFVIFETPEYGRKALIGDINSKIKQGLNTPDSFINKYTPTSKENPEDSRKNYKEYMAKELGINHPNDSFPENSAEKIADAITNFESGSWKKNKNKDEPVSTNETVSSVVEDTAPSGVVPDTRPSDMPGVAEAEKKGLGALGAAAGATTAGAVEKGKILLPLIPNAYRAIMQQPLNENAPTTRSNLQTGMQRYLQSQHHQKVHLDDLEKAYNDFLKAKDPTAEAKKLRTMAEVQEALKAVKPTGAERTKVGSGQRGSIYRTTAGSSGIDLSKYAPNPNTPVTNAVKSGIRTAGNVGRAVLPVAARVATGALGGLNALTEGYDTAESYKKHGAGDRRTIGKGMKTFGGGLMMIPGLQVPGAALTALGMIPDEGVDYYNELKQRQSEATPESMRQAFESYPMGN